MTTNWPAGQAAFITGAASGIGLGMARALVAAGAKVALADIDAGRLAEAEKELTEAGGAVVALSLDVTDAEQWQLAADRAEEVLGHISILCNNAGVNGGAELDSTPLDVWRWVHKVDVESQFIGIATFLPRFKTHGGRAHIVNTASMAGLVPMARVGAYSSAKFASAGLSMVLRSEVAGTDIGVSVLCPGTVRTRIGENSVTREAELLGKDINTAALEGNNALLAQGADPDKVGEQVVEAMQQRQFLIITHRDWWPLVDAVHTEIRTAFDQFDNRYGPDISAQILAQGANPVTA